MSDYYVIGPNGERYGPANADTLTQWASQGRVTPASTVIDLSNNQQMPVSAVPGFIAPPPVPLPIHEYPRGPQHVPYQRVESNLVKAILSTLFCCLPLGVVAIVYASQVEGHVRRGDYVAARAAADKASAWANWSIGLVLAYALIVLAFGGFSSLTGR